MINREALWHGVIGIVSALIVLAAVLMLDDMSKAGTLTRLSVSSIVFVTVVATTLFVYHYLILKEMKDKAQDEFFRKAFREKKDE